MNALSNFFEVLARLSLQAVTKTEIAILSLVMVSVCFAEKFCFIEHGEVQASQFVLLQRMYVGLEWRAQLSFSESWQAALQWCILRYLMASILRKDGVLKQLKKTKCFAYLPVKTTLRLFRPLLCRLFRPLLSLYSYK